MTARANTMPANPAPTPRIYSYHAHVYYDPERTRDTAAWLRERVAERFTVRVGRWHDVPVGPHRFAMYQLAFSTGVFADLVPWLMLNRNGLVILVHPNTGAPRADHLSHSLWLGEILPLNGDALPETEEPVEEA